MVHKSAHENFLMFYPEIEVCQPPQAPATWASAGTAIEFTALDLSGVKEALVADPTLERDPMAVGRRKRIRGIRNSEWNFTAKLHGTGATTVEDSLVAETYLSKIMLWVMGGQFRTPTKAVVSGTATTLVVDDAAGFAPGCLVAVEDTTSPDEEHEGKLHFRRVIQVDDGTNTLTLSEDLPFTPTADDVIHGTITSYLDSTRLVDAVRGGGVYTWSWLAKLSQGDADHLYQLEGCVATPAFGNLARGQLPTLQLNVMAANFRHAGEDGLTEPTFPAAQGRPQLSMGVDVQCSIGEYGNTDLNLCDVNQVGFEPGYSRVRVETTTETLDRFHGMSTYSMAPADCKFTATTLPYDAAWYSRLNQGDEQRINFYQPGPGTGPGKAWCIHIPRAQIGATPGMAAVNEVRAATLEFLAMVPDDCTGGSNPKLEQSIWLFGMA
ncbi:hypothetical protein OV203_02450 [Nannocystis sp. ILAH1]|uniref:hypothetical protein n=1 Tax=Nannocystis sp. ILAH1 TaxID=2996789 RepID=UPI0022711724|nr:hypothetical protein [Nannocystis sp. ILAH1]MCY0985972.1 hypothetical protein [Nannocystis sp. ILAH1]